MKYIVLIFAMVAAASAATISMSQHAPAGYNFHYAAGDAGGHSRSESGHGGNVAGSYSYIDPNGHVRQVSYTAGPDGFKATGDTGVDRKTAADAAAIAALAPKAPPAAHPVAPHHVAAPSHHWLGHNYYGGHHAYAGHHAYGPSGYVAVW